VICTRNRAAQLTEALGRLDRNEIVAESAELVLVDSASTDATPKVIAEFAENAPFPVRQCRVHRPGLGRARNEGVNVLLPNVRVYHDHRRKLGTPGGDEALRDYDFGRGAYYASLLQRGVGGAWQLWSAGTPVSEPMPAQTAERLATEMEGASRYLRHLAVSRGAT